MLFILKVVIILNLFNTAVPLGIQIPFKTEKECMQALENLEFGSPAPVLDASGTCEKQLQT